MLWFNIYHNPINTELEFSLTMVKKCWNEFKDKF